MNKMIAYRKKRRAAVWILVGAAVFSVLFGTWRSVSAARADRLAEFYRDMGISSDLNERQTQAYNMVTVALKYLSSADEDVKAVLEARSDLMNAQNISDMFDANVALTEATTTLDAKLTAVDMSDSDSQALSRIAAELISRNATISHDSYNETAQEFNDKILGGTPAKYICTLFGVKALEFFR